MVARHLLIGQAISLELEERQQVGIDRVRFRSGHAMREVLVGFQGPVLQQLCGQRPGCDKYVAWRAIGFRRTDLRFERASGLPPQKAYDWNGSFVPKIGRDR